MDRLLKHRLPCSILMFLGSSDRLMDRLLKQFKSFWISSSNCSSDRLMDRLLKQITLEKRLESFWVRVTVWWIDYWNAFSHFSSPLAMNVRVTVWWIDYWNNEIHSPILKELCSSDRLMDRLLKHAYRVRTLNLFYCSSDRLMDRLLKPT